jgi:hypothetical protein|tara:strand:+ start:205 stop:381 length:177 start_codon:yes stop_codon:yes gene_type:complete
MKSTFECKQEVLIKWQELIDSMSLHLEAAKKAGGTLGHKVGSELTVQKRRLDGYKRGL